MQTQTRAFRAPDALWTAIVAAAGADGVNASEILRRAAASYEPVKRVFGPARIDRTDAGVGRPALQSPGG